MYNVYRWEVLMSWPVVVPAIDVCVYLYTIKFTSRLLHTYYVVSFWQYTVHSERLPYG